MAIIPKPPFPNVPKLPGVPQVARSLNFPAAPPAVVSLGVAGYRLWQSIFNEPTWAIYKYEKPTRRPGPGELEELIVPGNRQPVVTPDNFLEFGYRNEFSLSDYPIQDGGFASYDKVENPYEAFVRMSKGGTKEARKKFLDDIESIVGTLDLYDIFTPERTYVGVNVLRFEISRRGNKGAFFFSEVDLFFREIREVSATYTTTLTISQNANDVSAIPRVSSGVVQGLALNATPESLGIASGAV